MGTSLAISNPNVRTPLAHLTGGLSTRGCIIYRHHCKEGPCSPSKAGSIVQRALGSRVATALGALKGDRIAVGASSGSLRPAQRKRPTAGLRVGYCRPAPPHCILLAHTRSRFGKRLATLLAQLSHDTARASGLSDRISARCLSLTGINRIVARVIELSFGYWSC
jgi:hypothetical protein